MAKRVEKILQLTLLISADAMQGFTTLLQAGSIIEVDHPTSVGEFLSSLPGFTPQYITERVETIFLDGLPVDDLEKVITGSRPVLAISAAMPGLAGAIFRKNSFHAPLRSAARKNDGNGVQGGGTIRVVLKLFNVVAKERGKAMLAGGCLLDADTLLKSIRYRPQLFSQVLQYSCNDMIITIADLQNCLSRADMVFMRVETDDTTQPPGTIQR